MTTARVLPPGREWLTVAETAVSLGMSTVAVYGMLAAGTLPGHRFGNGRGVWRVNRAQLDAMAT
jgi:excisionase family DNA binding protein